MFFSIFNLESSRLMLSESVVLLESSGDCRRSTLIWMEGLDGVFNYCNFVKDLLCCYSVSSSEVTPIVGMVYCTRLSGLLFRSVEFLIRFSFSLLSSFA